MKRIVVKCSAGDSYLNVPGDRLEYADGFAFMYEGERLIGIADITTLDLIYITEKKEREQ